MTTPPLNQSPLMDDGRLHQSWADYFQADGNQSVATATLVSHMGDTLSSAVASGAAVALVTAVAKDIATLSLPIGDWDVSGTVGFLPAATTVPTVLGGWVGTVANTVPAEAGLGSAFHLELSFATGARQVFAVGAQRFLLTVATTVRLGALAAFTVSTMGAFGFMLARRRK